jgi:hypothetical protein
LESRAALQQYFEGPAPVLFAEQRKPFEQHLRMERNWGPIDARLP